MTLRVSLDTLNVAPIHSALADLERYAPGLSKLDCESLGEVGRLAIELLNGEIDFGECVAIDGDLSTGGAGRMAVSIKPSELFLDLLSALRAVEGEVDAVCA